MDPVSCRMRLESLLTIGLYIRQDAFQLWLRFLFRPVLFLYLYNVTPQTFALILFFRDPQVIHRLFRGSNNDAVQRVFHSLWIDMNNSQNLINQRFPQAFTSRFSCGMIAFPPSWEPPLRPRKGEQNHDGRTEDFLSRMRRTGDRD